MVAHSFYGVSEFSALVTASSTSSWRSGCSRSRWLSSHLPLLLSEGSGRLGRKRSGGHAYDGGQRSASLDSRFLDFGPFSQDRFVYVVPFGTAAPRSCGFGTASQLSVCGVLRVGESTAPRSIGQGFLQHPGSGLKGSSTALVGALRGSTFPISSSHRWSRAFGFGGLGAMDWDSW